jgi:hypothetical protein
MSGTLTNSQRARIQESIDARKEKRDKNRRNSQLLAERQEKLQLQQSANLRMKMVFIFADIDGERLILTIVDPSLMNSEDSVERNHHIKYGSSEYNLIHMRASYSPRGKRSKLIKNDQYSYTVSTADGINFDIIGTDGTTILSFETVIDYESLAGRSFSGVQFDQFWYDPFKCPFDAETAKFDAVLNRLIKADADYVSENPNMKKGYFRFGI